MRAKRAREKHHVDERLIAERNALLDVLNGVMNSAGLKDAGFVKVEGRQAFLIPHEATLGKPRLVINAVPTPRGTLIMQNPDLAVTGEGKSLFVVPVEAHD